MTIQYGQLVKGLEALKCFESVPRRWPLATLAVPLLKSVEYLDRVLAGCCWEVLISRTDLDDSIGALRQAAKSLILALASCLAHFVAETLRASRTLQRGPLIDEENIYLLGANFWVQPIHQELLHAASGHNVSGDGERKRPCSGLVKIVATGKKKNVTSMTISSLLMISKMCCTTASSSTNLITPALVALASISFLVFSHVFHACQCDVGKTESWTSSPGRHGQLRISNSSSRPAR